MAEKIIRSVSSTSFSPTVLASCNLTLSKNSLIKGRQKSSTKYVSNLVPVCYYNEPLVFSLVEGMRLRTTLISNCLVTNYNV